MAYDTVLHGTDPVRCKAHSSRSGKPCKAWAIHGGNVCVAHGGSAPQVREAARRRILTHAERAIETLVAALDDPSSPWASRVRAAQDLLNRAGMAPATEVSVSEAPATNADLDAAIMAALQRRTASE